MEFKETAPTALYQRQRKRHYSHQSRVEKGLIYCQLRWVKSSRVSSLDKPSWFSCERADFRKLKYPHAAFGKSSQVSSFPTLIWTQLNLTIGDGSGRVVDECPFAALLLPMHSCHYIWLFGLICNHPHHKQCKGLLCRLQLRFYLTLTEAFNSVCWTTRSKVYLSSLILHCYSIGY